MKKWFKSLAISVTAASAILLVAASASAANVGSWAAGTSMGTARQGATATLLPNGQVLVAGGETTAGAKLNSTEIYTPTGSGSWAAGTSMSTQREYFSARALSDARVMVMGGYNGSALNSTEIYNPSTTTWAAGKSMNTARYDFSSATLLNGRILAIGGYDGTNALKSTEIYNPTTNTWAAGPNLNTARRGSAAVNLMDGRILVVGGLNGSTYLNTTEIYSPGTNSWTAGPNMTTARDGAGIVILSDGKVLVVGGFDGTTYYNTTEIYSSATNSFTADANLGTAREFSAITQLQDGKVLVVGGTSDGSTYLDTTEIGTFPSTNEKTTTPQITDLGNNGNAKDIRVMFYGAANETFIKEYRVFVQLSGDSTVASGADAASLDGTSNRYFVEPVKGKGRLHLIYLPQTLTKADGTAIDTTTGSYKVYVLAKGKPGYGDVISTVSSTVPFSVTAFGSATNIKAPSVLDASNNHDSSDIKVSFTRPTGESGFLASGGAGTYRVYIVPNSVTDATFRASSWFSNTNYYAFDKAATTSAVKRYIVSVGAATKDSNGIAVAEGTAYRIYIAAIGATGTVKDSVLSPSSNIITLSPYVPAVSAVRGVSELKTGTGHTSDLINVKFYEPSNVRNIQDYRIFLVSSTATLTQALADTNATVANNCYIYTPTPITANASRSIQLGAGIKAYNGSGFNDLTSGAYKVYILSYTGTAYANKLSSASVGIVTLD